MLCGISPPFGGLFHIRGKVAHVLLTRSPRASLLYCYNRPRVRLACVRHAASVRSEPGSNSRLKPGSSCPEPNPASRAVRIEENRRSLGSLNRTGSDTFHPIVKELAPWPAGGRTGNSPYYAPDYRLSSDRCNELNRLRFPWFFAPFPSAPLPETGRSTEKFATVSAGKKGLPIPSGGGLAPLDFLLTPGCGW